MTTDQGKKRLVLALDEARRMEKELNATDRLKEDQRNEELAHRLELRTAPRTEAS